MCFDCWHSFNLDLSRGEEINIQRVVARVPRPRVPPTCHPAPSPPLPPQHAIDWVRHFSQHLGPRLLFSPLAAPSPGSFSPLPPDFTETETVSRGDFFFPPCLLIPRDRGRFGAGSIFPPVSGRGAGGFFFPFRFVCAFSSLFTFCQSHLFV